MTKRGLHLALQRLASLVAGTAAVASMGAIPMIVSAALLGLSLAFYIFWPVPAAPDGTLRYDRGPAVIGPDLMGLVLVSGLAGLPLIAGRVEGDILHPSAVLLWPMAAAFASLLVIGWRRAAFALWIGGHGFRADTGSRHVFLRFDKIAAVEPWQRDLVRSLRPLAWILAAMGRPGPAGALLVSRASSGIALVRRDGTRWIIPGDAFKTGIARVLEACEANGIPFRPPQDRAGANRATPGKVQTDGDPI